MFYTVDINCNQMVTGQSVDTPNAACHFAAHFN